MILKLSILFFLLLTPCFSIEIIEFSNSNAFNTGLTIWVDLIYILVPVIAAISLLRN